MVPEQLHTADGEAVTVYRATAPHGQQVTGVFAYARNRPPTSHTVHWVPAEVTGDLVTLLPSTCRTRVGELRTEMSAGETLCSRCREEITEGARRRDLDQRATEALTLGQVRAHIWHLPADLAELAFNQSVPELLVGLIRDVPGRKYDRERRVWQFPDAWSPDLAESLRNAGAEVRESTHQAVCGTCGRPWGSDH